MFSKADEREIDRRIRLDKLEEIKEEKLRSVLIKEIYYGITVVFLFIPILFVGAYFLAEEVFKLEDRLVWLSVVGALLLSILIVSCVLRLSFQFVVIISMVYLIIWFMYTILPNIGIISSVLVPALMWHILTNRYKLEEIW